MADRDLNDPRWKACRFATFARDQFTCCLCHKKGSELECHHIIRYADRPELQFVINNLITLCKNCHTLVTGREDEFKEQFQRMVALKKAQYVQKKGKSKKFKYKPDDPLRRY